VVINISASKTGLRNRLFKGTIRILPPRSRRPSLAASSFWAFQTLRDRPHRSVMPGVMVVTWSSVGSYKM
jgi:hypothetical protein